MKVFLFLSVMLMGMGFKNGGGDEANLQAVAGKPGVVLEEFLYTSAPFPSCHAVTIVELRNRELLATYFGGTAERNPDVEIRLQRKKTNGTWTAPISVADGIQPDGKRFPTWNPVIFQPKGGELMLYYKVGPNPREWWGEYKTSADNGYTWSKAHKLPANLLGPIKNKPVQLSDGTILAGSSTENNGWVAHLERSTDGGKSWTFIGPLNDPKQIGAIQPTFLTYKNGSIQLLCRTSGSKDGFVAACWSRDKGLTWSEMKNTLLPNNNSGLDAVTLKDGRQVLVYNHSTHDEKDRGHNGRGVINVAVSRDGTNWEAALILDYSPEPDKQYAYPSIIQTSDGLVHIVYTWNRKRIKHVVIDPDKLKTFPITGGKWPYNKIPLVKSTEE